MELPKEPRTLRQRFTLWSKPNGLLLFLTLHLLVVGLSAFRGVLNTAEYAKLKPQIKINYPPILTSYSALTASDQGYGFFAPAVSSDVRFIIRSASSSGGHWHERTLPNDFAGENAMGTFLGLGLNEEGPRAKWIQELLAKSVATGVFNRYPEDNLIVVQYQVEVLGPLRQGPADRQWVNLRVYTFYR